VRGRKISWAIAFVLSLSSITIRSALAQDGEGSLELGLRRNLGYGGVGEIQGQFTMSAQGPQGLVKVQFLIDGQVVWVDEETPFSYRFSTNEYSLGDHLLGAIGIMADGRQLHAQGRRMEFVSADVGWQAAGEIAVPLVIGLALIALLGTLGTSLLGRRRSFQVGVYGWVGGAVCPRCRLPYSRGVLSPNLLAGKLERCPHCGKWALAALASTAELAAAEADFHETEHRDASSDALNEDDLRRKIEESRFDS